jgi:hypothetical protein
MKTFLDKDKLSKFIVTKSALQEMLNHSLQSKEKVYSKKKKRKSKHRSLGKHAGDTLFEIHNPMK